MVLLLVPNNLLRINLNVAFEIVNVNCFSNNVLCAYGNYLGNMFHFFFMEFILMMILEILFLTWVIIRDIEITKVTRS